MCAFPPQVASLKDWLQLVLKCELPPGQLPELLRDGEILFKLAEAVLPSNLPAASPAARLDAFVSCSRALGVPEGEVLHPGLLLPPAEGSSAAPELLRALMSFARAAADQQLAPAANG